MRFPTGWDAILLYYRIFCTLLLGLATSPIAAFGMLAT